MRYRIFNKALLVFSLLLAGSCIQRVDLSEHIRPLADTIGFTQYDWQMDDIVLEITTLYGDRINKMLQETGISETESWKLAISPHDDYAYAGFMYPAALRNVKANTVILFGVAHKARLLNLEDQIIFDSYDTWKGPYGNVKISGIREEIIEQLSLQQFQVNDSMHRMEHSLEALIPFLQYQNRDIEIVPILVPYMPYEKMNSIAIKLAEVIQQVVTEKKWQWGKDFALVISNDAVHYGDEDWGGKNFARYGADSAGFMMAMKHEQEIIQTLTEKLNPEKIKRFCNYTVQQQNYKEYKWTWCGRYSVPFGLLTAFHLNNLYTNDPLNGYFIGYASSIDHEKLEVENIGMGVTAPANIRHWVGYAAIGYK